MHFSTVLVALNFGSAALAFPLYNKRQESTSVQTEVISTGTSTVAAEPTPSAAVSEAVESAVESALPSASASGSADIDYSSYPCPEGYLLTYAEAQRTYETPFSALEEAGVAGSWSSAAQYPSGGNADAEDEDGASRTVESTNFGTISETLVNTETREQFYQAESNLTEPITSQAGLIISNWTYVYQVFANATAGEEASTVKLFANACASDQMTGEMELQTLFSSSFDNLQTDISAPPMQSGASSMMSGASQSFATATIEVATAIPIPTITQQNTQTEISVDSQTETEVETSTQVSVDSQTETQTSVQVSTEVSVNEQTETATSVQISTEVSVNEQTETATSVQVSTEISVNEQTETATATQTDLATVTATEVVTSTPQVADVTSQVVAEVTSQVVVPSVVAPAPSA